MNTLAIFINKTATTDFCRAKDGYGQPKKDGEKVGEKKVEKGAILASFLKTKSNR
jgi:hypothetical protein